MIRFRMHHVALLGLGMFMLCMSFGVMRAGPTPTGYHWARKPSAFTLQVGDNVDDRWGAILREAVANWNTGDTVTFRVVSGKSSAQQCQPTKGQVEVCNGLYGTQEGWLGLTRLYFDKSGEHIEEATVQMNDSFFDQRGGRYNSDAVRQHTMCHELGHTPGLEHVDTASCMNDSQSAVFTNLVPIKQDFREFARIYRHQDATTTVAGKQKKDKHDKRHRDERDRQRGQEREPRHTDSETVSVETLADGRILVTHITWAEE